VPHKRRPGPGGPIRLTVALVTVLATSAIFVAAGLPVGVQAGAATVVNGCTIVSDPTPTSYTKCPGADLSGQSLQDLNLSYADLKGANLSSATMALCEFVGPPAIYTCDSTDLTSAKLSHANFGDAEVSSCVTFSETPTLQAVECTGADFSDAVLTEADFSDTDLSSATFKGALLNRVDLSGDSFVDCYSVATGGGAGYEECPGTDFSDAVLPHADLHSANLATVNFAGANLTDSNLSEAQLGYAQPPPAGTSVTSFDGAILSRVNLSGTDTSLADLADTNLKNALFTGTPLVPENESVVSTGRRTAASWATPPSQPGATPGTCNHPSGSTFKIGSTTVTCSVVDSAGHHATGTFTVTVTPSG
jgi:uncharacterized protein YjbI with pentapeptide repeats